jgi:hypothetical protein
VPFPCRVRRGSRIFASFPFLSPAGNKREKKEFQNVEKGKEARPKRKAKKKREEEEEEEEEEELK